jgi:uracil-DNA glycosylase
MAHSSIGWQEITNAVAAELGKRNVVAILWGKYAGELSPYFRQDWIIQSVHPSPLSAYRGFFGSKPFSSSNQILIKNGMLPIDW